MRTSLEHSVPQIGAPEAWAAGHTGSGATVAVLDTGIDTTHPDLDDAVTGAQDFTGSESGADDRVGHGTHVASIITGDGEVNKGVAPDVKLLNGKVLDDYGWGYDSSIIAGMEWAARGGADVINMSVGTDFGSAGTDPVEQALNRLSAETGALFVVAAGNAGPGTESVGSPGAADAALTVGAVDRQDGLAEFSSRGPRLEDGAIKPDITAPGVGIVAANAASLGGGYAAHSGTSMAAPHVAGAAAILAARHPDWTGDQLKSTLMSTAEANPDLSIFEQGAGRVDVAAATGGATVTASPGSLSLGLAQWPHTDDEPIAKKITYTNTGAEPVTLDLAADMTAPDGKPAPAGMFTVTPAQLTVPAGGTATATLTTDTRVQAVDGVYSGTVVATGGDRTLHTPTAVNREVESYDVTFTFLDREGKPTPRYGFSLMDHVNPEWYSSYDESGTVAMRLPKGTYFFAGSVLAGPFTPVADFIEPALVVDAPAEHTFDARDGVKLGFVVDRPEARTAQARVQYTMDTEWGDRYYNFWDFTNFDDFQIRPSRTAAPDGFEFQMQAQLARPDGSGGFHASPYLYNLRYTDDSRIPADLVHEVPDTRLAKVISSHAVATPGKIGIREQFLTMPLPFTLTEFYTPDVEWRPNFYDTTSVEGWPDGVLNTAEPRTYQRGRTTRERWNVGVFGPRFSFDHRIPLTRTGRVGDLLQFSAGMYTDQNRDTHGSTPSYLTANTELFRDGELIDEWGSPGYIQTELPPEKATYTVRTTATRPGTLSTKIDGEWTFSSSHTEGDVPTPIPALAVRFAPNLDDHNTAPTGKFCFPVYVQRNATTHPGKVNPPTVEISYDDGQTWKPVRLTRHQDQWQAEVNHPKGAKFASLRSSISDAEGNTAKVTIIHAYALK
jgi:hypothetical protein